MNLLIAGVSRLQGNKGYSVSKGHVAHCKGTYSNECCTRFCQCMVVVNNYFNHFSCPCKACQWLFAEQKHITVKSRSHAQTLNTRDAWEWELGHIKILAPSSFYKLSCTLIYSRARSSTLNVLKFSMRIDERFLSFAVTLDGLLTTIVLVWPELMIVNESWSKLS